MRWVDDFTKESVTGLNEAANGSGKMIAARLLYKDRGCQCPTLRIDLPQIAD